MEESWHILLFALLVVSLLDPMTGGGGRGGRFCCLFGREVEP